MRRESTVCQELKKLRVISSQEGLDYRAMEKTGLAIGLLAWVSNEAGRCGPVDRIFGSDFDDLLARHGLVERRRS